MAIRISDLHANDWVAPVVHAPFPRADTAYLRWGKPAFDRAAAVVLLVVLSPLLLLAALAVRVALGPGVLYRQRRVGLAGRAFTIVKFRTMRADRRHQGSDRRAVRRAGHGDRRQCHKRDDDPRHTALGRALRATRIDELPQLWNVARGEMSLVGPRPELVEVTKRYEPWQHRRHAVRPGITGPWQLADRGDALMHSASATAVDLAYVDEVSFLGDLAILARTPLVPLRRCGR